MTLTELIRRLKRNKSNMTLMADFLKRYQQFINYMLSRLSTVSGLDPGDVEQELRGKLFELIDEYNLKFNDKQGDQYIKTSLKNRTMKLIRDHADEQRRHRSLDEPIQSEEGEGEEQHLIDKIKDTSEDIMSMLMRGEKEELVAKLEDELNQEAPSSEIASLARDIFEQIISGSEEKTQIFQWLQSQGKGRSMGSIDRAIDYLKKKVQNLGLTASAV
jgi:hypothetical protein